MTFFASPASLRVRELPAALLAAYQQHIQRRDPSTSFLTSYPQVPLMADSLTDGTDMVSSGNLTSAALAVMAGHGSGGASHPDFLHLAGLVSEAVLEVVFVALPGYLVAVTGMFDANSQKFVAELNTMVFTPCLIFTKLASQLNADKLSDLVVIPFIFLAQTLVSFCCAQLMAKAFGFWGKKWKRQKNFILAMAVFGNSNSLPISLVISLSKTISGLHWDQIPGDNDNEVAARGILYLLIFQQLGQVLRWTWGYSVLLAPARQYEEEERAEDAEGTRAIEEGAYRDDPDSPPAAVKTSKSTDSGFNSGFSTPSGRISDVEDNIDGASSSSRPHSSTPTPLNGNAVPSNNNNRPHALSRYSTSSVSTTSDVAGWKVPFYRIKHTTVLRYRQFVVLVRTYLHNLFRAMPHWLQKPLRIFGHYAGAFLRGVWRQMNPPLWAMLAALLVASIPALQHAFFTKGTFLSNSVSRAISQSGGVAVPLILVVLGANLARSTLPADQVAVSPEDKSIEKKLLFASVLSRMVLPTIIMAPLLALAAKYVPVSILDDPIFIIVCFLLTGAPSALQLAQICQINEVFMGVMSNLLVVSYVVMIFPSTLLLVLLGLEVVEWAVV